MGADHRFKAILVQGAGMKRLAIGLALNGGTAKRVAHIGVIRALEENRIPIDYLAGTSGGAMVASDLTTREKMIFREGKVAIACQASSSIPEFYTPVEIDGHILVDGGITEYVPISALASLGEMFTIGVNLGFEQGSSKKPRHLIEMIVQVTNFIAQQNAVVSERLADFMIHPDLGEFSSLDLNKASRMIRKAYRETLQIVPDLKTAIKVARGAGRGSNASKTSR